MPFVTSDDIRAEQDALAKRARELQDALDHAHAIVLALDADEHQLHAYTATLIDGLTNARHATAMRVRHNEGILARVLREERDKAGIPVPE